MPSNTSFHMALPTPPSSSQKAAAAARRPPLTPSTVSSPALSTQSPEATRRDSTAGTRASHLLAKVASHPPGHKDSPVPSPLPSPGAKPPSAAVMHPPYAVEKDCAPPFRCDAERYWRQQGACWRVPVARLNADARAADGYISFPDFEKVCQSQNPHQTVHT